MPTVPAGLVISLNGAGDGTTPIGFRRALAVLFRQASPGVAMPGRLGSDHFVVSGSTTSMVYNVSGGGLVLVRSTTNGAYLVGVPDNQVVPTSAADGVNPRIDRIYAKQLDPALDGTGSQAMLLIDVAVGTPAASPLLPTLPSGALELGRKLIAAGATNTAAGAPFTDAAPETGLNLGSVVPLTLGGTGASTKAQARANLGITSGTAAPNNAVGADGDLYFQIIG